MSRRSHFTWFSAQTRNQALNVLPADTSQAVFDAVFQDCVFLRAAESHSNYTQFLRIAWFYKLTPGETRLL